MAIVCIDWETFYSKEYSLSKMSDVEYVLDPRFQTIMCAIKVGRAPTETFVGHDAVAQRLNMIEWRTTALLAHKVSFDGSILAWHYGHVPALYLDTLSMARATTHWHTGSSSLKRVSEYLDLPPKGDEVVKAQGKRLEDFSPDELAAYRAYCARDNENAREIFDLLRPAFLDTELRLIDLVARMFILPQVMLDAGVLHEHLIDVQERKAAIMQQVLATVDASVFSSNAKFAVLLREHGVEVPMKRSPTTGEEIPALARGDWAFKELCADENQSLEVQALLAARIAAKSTLEETRTANLLRLSEIDWPRQGRGWAPVPLKYSGARTHRLSGDGGLNWQNFQRGSRIRAAVTAPAGYRIIHRDASQIEARMVAWLAGCETLLQAFAEGRDVYSEFASTIYDRPVSRDDKLERFVGKTAVLGLGYGCGAVKFRHMLFIGNGGQSIQVAEDFARNTVFLYRDVYREIPALWQLVGYLLSKLTGKPRTDRVGWEQQLPRLPVTPAAQALYLPSGLPLAYPEIRWFRDPATGREELCYTDQYQQPRRIYGAMGVENISQGLARIVVTDIAVAIKAETGYAPFLSTHDSLDYCVPASEAEALDTALEDAFAVPPVWAAGLPLASEGGWGRTLLDAERAVNA